MVGYIKVVVEVVMNWKVEWKVDYEWMRMKYDERWKWRW